MAMIIRVLFCSSVCLEPFRIDSRVWQTAADGRTDGQTDIIVANAAFHYVIRGQKMDSIQCLYGSTPQRLSDFRLLAMASCFDRRIWSRPIEAPCMRKFLKGKAPVDVRRSADRSYIQNYLRNVNTGCCHQFQFHSLDISTTWVNNRPTYSWYFQRADMAIALWHVRYPDKTPLEKRPREKRPRKKGHGKKGHGEETPRDKTPRGKNATRKKRHRIKPQAEKRPRDKTSASCCKPTQVLLKFI